jgi:hypothetical protein
LPPAVIALNLSEENKRIHERVNALTHLGTLEEVFWRNQSKAPVIAKFQDRVQQVHRFFTKCHTVLRITWKVLFPLNAVPPTLLALMYEFGNVRKIRRLVRSQLVAGAQSAFALLLSKHPAIDLMTVANADGDVGHLFDKVLIPSTIVSDRMEHSSKVGEKVLEGGS